MFMQLVQYFAGICSCYNNLSIQKYFHISQYTPEHLTISLRACFPYTGNWAYQEYNVQVENLIPWVSWSPGESLVTVSWEKIPHKYYHVKKSRQMTNNFILMLAYYLGATWLKTLLSTTKIWSLHFANWRMVSHRATAYIFMCVCWKLVLFWKLQTYFVSLWQLSYNGNDLEFWPAHFTVCSH